MNKPHHNAMLNDVAAETRSLLVSLTPEEWDAASLCAEWSIRDVAAHLVSGTSTPIPVFLAEMIRARGRFHAANTADAKRVAQQVRTGDLIAAIADSGRRGIGGLLPPRLLLGDHVVHLLDIAHPLGREVTLAHDVLSTVLNTELCLPNPFVPAARIGRGLTFEAYDIGWHSGRSGPTVHGKATDLITALAGRRPTLDRLEGDGVTTLTTRVHAWNPAR